MALSMHQFGNPSYDVVIDLERHVIAETRERFHRFFQGGNWKMERLS